MTTYEFAKELIQRQSDYLMKMIIIDNDLNKGKREEAQRTLTWLEDVANDEFGRQDLGDKTVIY